MNGLSWLLLRNKQKNKTEISAVADTRPVAYLVQGTSGSGKSVFIDVLCSEHMRELGRSFTRPEVLTSRSLRGNNDEKTKNFNAIQEDNRDSRWHNQEYYFDDGILNWTYADANYYANPEKVLSAIGKGEGFVLSFKDEKVLEKFKKLYGKYFNVKTVLISVDKKEVFKNLDKDVAKGIRSREAVEKRKVIVAQEIAEYEKKRAAGFYDVVIENELNRSLDKKTKKMLESLGRTNKQIDVVEETASIGIFEDKIKQVLEKEVMFSAIPGIVQNEIRVGDIVEIKYEEASYIKEGEKVNFVCTAQVIRDNKVVTEMETETFAEMIAKVTEMRTGQKANPENFTYADNYMKMMELCKDTVHKQGSTYNYRMPLGLTVEPEGYSFNFMLPIITHQNDEVDYEFKNRVDYGKAKLTGSDGYLNRVIINDLQNEKEFNRAFDDALLNAYGQNRVLRMQHSLKSENFREVFNNVEIFMESEKQMKKLNSLETAAIEYGINDYKNHYKEEDLPVYGKNTVNKNGFYPILGGDYVKGDDGNFHRAYVRYSKTFYNNFFRIYLNSACTSSRHLENRHGEASFIMPFAEVHRVVRQSLFAPKDLQEEQTSLVQAITGNSNYNGTAYKTLDLLYNDLIHEIVDKYGKEQAEKAVKEGKIPDYKQTDYSKQVRGELRSKATAKPLLLAQEEYCGNLAPQVGKVLKGLIEYNNNFYNDPWQIKTGRNRDYSYYLDEYEIRDYLEEQMRKPNIPALPKEIVTPESMARAEELVSGRKR